MRDADTLPATADGMQRYYAKRAAEYERIYDKPERQADLAAIKAWLPRWFAGRDVLEVACGTGWWTPHAARDAASWAATDVNEEVLALARLKPQPHGRVRFEIADAWALQGPRRFGAAFAGFWWSHVALGQASAWIDRLHAALAPGAQVVFLDNRYVEGSSQPVTRHDADGNTFQTRRLDDGSTHEVLKNFPAPGELQLLLGARARDFAWTEWPHFWACTYNVNATAP